MEDCDVDADVDVRDPDEKSIMTYVAQFLQYSRDLPASEEEMQVVYVYVVFYTNVKQHRVHTAETCAEKV